MQARFMESTLASKSAASAWSPLRQSLFRALWVASLISNIGTWMHEVGAAWLMTALAQSPLLVSLLQTATNLPIFLLGLPAGALADVVDRRKLLLFAQSWMAIAAACLGILTLFGLTTPWLLLGFTFVLGIGSALNMPAWQAITPELVSRDELPAAAALGGISFNTARAVGPALGGLVVAAAGPWAVFLLNAISFVSVIFVLYRMESPPRQNALPAERLPGAIQAGLRYLRHAPSLRAIIIRVLAFISCGSAVWALLPLVARQGLKLTSFGYGLLLGCLGLGAVLGASALPKMLRQFGTDALLSAATLLWAGVAAALAYLHQIGWLCAIMILGGSAWTIFMSNLNAAAQAAVPAWVRARALAVYTIAFVGGMAGGSALWGMIATRAGISASLLCAALGLVAGLLIASRYRLEEHADMDLTPSLHWPMPSVAVELDPEDGPVLVTVEYRIDPAKSRDFVKAMNSLRRLRLRDGATSWRLYQDVTDPGRYVENFIVKSWAEHLRQHERVTQADRAIEDNVRAFHIGPEPPAVSHFVAAAHEEVKE